ncbi:C-GCAxxG-C-C family protein [Xanthomarina sp.]|uniref:C-GCAxxG-C-C family protein n=1 Tax=Xanthomarina sp. TaxID=1931211 RepID=UPI002C4F7E30|nr:C-GCAxxG-C-C family protein [Xanthomarina sp.]HLV39953.1 C-GCAxxG-C-C family protein [Xanthomarina sp.]
MEKRDIAITKFLEGYNCAQSVFYSFCDYLNFDKETALKVSCGFGAGMGRKEEVCGAVTGGIMVLGVLYGRGENEDKSLTENTYRKTRDLIDSFVDKKDTVICRELLEGCDLSDPIGQKEFKEKDLLNKVCKECVGTAVDIVENIIGEKTK